MELSINNLVNVFSRINGEIDFGHVRWIDPSCIALLQVLHKSNNLVFDNNTRFADSVNGYLSAIFNAGNNNNQTFYPIKQITSRINLDVIAKDLSDIIIKRDDFDRDDKYEDFKGYLKYVLTEVMNNVIDHSGSQIGGYITAQYYPSRNTVQIAIADSGDGFLHKLQMKFRNVTTEEEAILKSVERQITGSLPDMYGAERNAGFGLYVISQIVELTGGRLLIVSNDTVINFDDGTHVVNKIDTDWKGSLVAFEINERFIDASLEDFLSDRIFVVEGEEIESIF